MGNTHLEFFLFGTEYRSLLVSKYTLEGYPEQGWALQNEVMKNLVPGLDDFLFKSALLS